VKLQTCEKKSNGLVHCSVENVAVLCENHLKKKKKEKILAVWRLSGSVLSQCFLVRLGVLFILKTVEDEW